MNTIKNLSFKMISKKEREFMKLPNLYNDWIDSGKKETFKDYKKKRKIKFMKDE